MTLLFRFLITLLFVVTLSIPSSAQDSPSGINLDVKEFRLKNGMLFLLVERHATPQVACHLSIRAGSALEDTGKTGIAHMLEHMMFKGTKNFGTTDLKNDMALQQQIEAAYQVVLAEERKRNPDQSIIQAKLKEMEELRLQVQKIYVPQAFSSQVGMNGAVRVNAFTSKDETQYFMSVPSDMVEQWFSIVSEQLFEPAWREFYVEKEVIQREWAFRYVNNPDGAAWLDLHAAAYTAHPYHNPTIGWKSDMEKFNTKDAMAFHRAYYNPTNAVVVLVGDLTIEKAKQLAEIYFERYPEGNRAPETVTKEPPQEGPRKSVRFLKGARTPNVLISFHAARMGTKDFDSLDAMTMILSQGRSARLTQEIVNQGLAQEAWAHNPDNRYGGMLILGGSPNEPEELKTPGLSDEKKQQAYFRACENLERILLAQIEKIKTERVTARELERIKKLNYRNFLEGLRSNEALATSMATAEVQAGWRSLITYPDRIAKVTPENIQEAAAKYVTEDNKTTVFVIPGGKPDRPQEPYVEVRSISGTEGLASTPDDFTNHSDYPTPESWKHPLSFHRQPHKIGYEKAETASIDGVPVFYLPDRVFPLIDLTLLVKAGSVDLSDTKTGLTQIFNDTLILGGTATYSPQELAMTLDENAIRLSVSVSEEDTVLRLSTMKQDWEKGLDLLGEIITHPRFEGAIIQVAKDQALTNLKRQGENARAVSMREAMIWHFKRHPYGRDPLKGLETIPGITREDLKAFLETYFVPSNMVLSVAGDVDKSAALESLRKLFQALPRKQAPMRNVEAPPQTEPVLALIHKPGQVQSQVTLALRSVQRTNPDYWRIGLLMNLFGGGDSLLYTRLREELGLVYATYFSETAKWKAGLLLGYIGSNGDATSRAIAETVEIMSALGKEVPRKELEQKRMDALNSFVFNVDTPLELVEAYGRYHMRQEPLDTLDRIQEAYISATQSELESLSRQFLDPSKLQVFVVGDKTSKVKKEDGAVVTLEEELQSLSKKLGLPYMEIPLR
ncbi:MAG: pitrilysin family protein [Deltaproteobacteria bacterium]|nr:pitrilysin family protein [Deltaproteobacteria bacterium]